MPFGLRRLPRGHSQNKGRLWGKTAVTTLLYEDESDESKYLATVYRIEDPGISFPEFPRV